MHLTYIKPMRLLSIILINIFLLTLIPPGLMSAQTNIDLLTPDLLDVSFRLNHEVLRQGQTGIGYDNVSFIDILFDPAYNVSSKSELQNIAILVNGSKNVTRNFDIDAASGFIRLTPKAGQVLDKHVLYNIRIPEGILTSSSNLKSNQTINLYFVTNTDEGEYDSDILQSLTPVDGSLAVDNTVGKITFEFIEDISMDQKTILNIDDYIEISTQKMNASIPGYNSAPSYQESDSVNNYNVQVDGNKLILQAKSKAFKDFANYTIKLKNNTIYLKRPYEDTKKSGVVDDTSAIRIYNQQEDNQDYQILKFSTGNMLSTTSPLDKATGVGVEPSIKFYFKYPVEFNQDIERADINSYITLSSDGSVVPLDSTADINISRDGKTLEISINDEQGNHSNPLRRNSLYQINIKPNLLRFVDYPVYNQEINLQFTTRSEGESPSPIRYSSDAAGSDDIRFLDHRTKDPVSTEKLTQLDSSGSIYIQFDRSIQADPQTDSNYISMLEAIHLYKMPGTESADNTSRTAYDLYQAQTTGVKDRIIPAAIPSADVADNYSILEDEYYMEEIPVGKVEIIKPDTVKVTPKSPLQNLNKYRLILDKQVIEDENGYNPDSNVEFSFWTKADSNNTSPKWQVPTSQTGTAQEDSTSVTKTYNLYGAPLYGPNQPLVLNIDTEVIPRAEDELLSVSSGQDMRRISYDQLMKIVLTDIYNSDSNTRLVEIGSYEFEYYWEANQKKTRLKIYPAQLLDNGKSYRLNVPEGILESRSKISMEAMQVNFTTNGDSSSNSTVYQLEDNIAKVTDVWKKGEWSFKILGNNFNENIEEVKLTPVSGRAASTAAAPLTITGDDVEFRSVTELLVKIRGDNALKFCQEGYTGQYKITVTFAGGLAQDIGVGTISDRDIILKGNNFRADVKKVTLQQVGGNTNVVLENTTSKQEIEFISSQQIKLKIRGVNAQTLAGTASSGEYTATIYYQTHTPWTNLNQWNLEVYGENFGDSIKNIVLRPLSGNALLLPSAQQDLVIAATEIERVNASKLIVKISGETLDKLKTAERAGNYQLLVQGNGMADYISDMTIFISNSYGIQVEQTVQADLNDSLSVADQFYIPDKFYFTLLSKGRPQAVAFYPLSSGKYDENSLPHAIQDAVTSNHQFLKVTLEDIDGKLDFNSMISMNNIMVVVKGSSSSVLDKAFLTLMEEKGTEYINKYILQKDRTQGLAYLWIPVAKMQSQMTYSVTIPAEVLKNDSLEQYNNPISWTFTSMSIPAVQEKNVLQTVGEDYDPNQPIIITGDNFYDSVSVYINGSIVKIDPPKDNGKGQKYIAVYLPEPRLEPGLYDITIANDSNHQQILYGTLSIVAAGKHEPTEGTRIRGDEHEGQVVETIALSEDTLLLKKSYSDKKKLEIDLDEIMGEDVLTRKIKWEGDKGDQIGQLITLSRWANVTLYDVSIYSTKKDDNVEIRLGRTPAALTRSLTNKLRGKAICSDFIEVSGDNLRLQSIDIQMPFRAADVENLKVLRYDESLRKWLETAFEVNWVDQRVSVTDSEQGIFVVVEQEGI